MWQRSVIYFVKFILSIHSIHSVRYFCESKILPPRTVVCRCIIFVIDWLFCSEVHIFCTGKTILQLTLQTPEWLWTLRWKYTFSIFSTVTICNRCDQYLITFLISVQLILISVKSKMLRTKTTKLISFYDRLFSILGVYQLSMSSLIRKISKSSFRWASKVRTILSVSSTFYKK